MRSRLPLACLVLLVAALAPAAHAATRDSMISSSYYQVFNRPPTAAETKYWSGRNDWHTSDDLVKFHFEGLKTNDALRDEAVRNALKTLSTKLPTTDALVAYWKQQLASSPRQFGVLTSDMRNWASPRENLIRSSYGTAFGPSPVADAELLYWQGRTDWKSVNDLIAFHRQGLKTNDVLADKAINNSYHQVFGRDPLQGEWNHWRPLVKRDGSTYTELVAAHKQWKASVPATIKSSPALCTALLKQNLALDPSDNIVRIDANTAARLRSAGKIVIDQGSNVVGPGGASLISNGPFLPAGGYLLTNNGGTIISHNGSALVSTNGGN